MRRSFFLVVASLFVLSPVTGWSQHADSSLLSIDRIFESREFIPQRFGPARWIDGGAGYTTLERSATAGGGRDIVRHDSRTGKRDVLIPAEWLIPKGGTSPLYVENYQWSADTTRLLIYTNSRRVWRHNTRGDYWVFRAADRSLRKAGGDAEPSTLMFAKFSPDGRKVAYIRGNNIYVEDVTTGIITQLTYDGSRTIINGTFDWVYEEEFDLRDGFRWSPDGSRIAYWQLDASGVRDFYLINNTDSLYSFVTPIQYPKAGETLSACRVGVIPAVGGATSWFFPPGDRRNNYIARMDWAGNSTEIVFQYFNRLQNTNRLMLGDVRTGTLKTILADQDSTWVEVVDSVHWLKNGSEFTWLSEQDGWTHLSIYSRAGERLRVLTQESFDVIKVASIDTANGWVYYIASPSDAGQRYLYRLRLDGKGSPERLTPQSEPGTHSYDISPNGRWAIHTYSRFGTPPVVDFVNLPSHAVQKVLVENAGLRRSVSRLRHGDASFFRVDIGGDINLDGWKMLPPSFDESKRYPLLVYVYGEPAGQTVLDSWGGRRYLWHLMLSQQGYIVLSIDNRGTPAPRGRAWRKAVYRQVGILASQDQAAALRQVRQWPYVDSTRIAVWGWSGGGSMTLNMMFRHPDLVQTGMAVAPVPDERLYDAIYQERYMGLPDQNVEGYRLGSPITFADSLRGNLLIVHGTGDDNVHYQGTERLVNALVKANKQFTMMSYPNRTHGINEGPNTTRHLYTLLTRFLMEHVEAGGR
ncbi:MAG: S9 family peptidase [Bacteroidota bacterium]